MPLNEEERLEEHKLAKQRVSARFKDVYTPCEEDMDVIGDMSDVMDSVLASAEVHVAEITELEFVKYILPIVMGDAEDYTPWLEIAGAIDRSIRVYESDDRKTLLFEVPPIVGDVVPNFQRELEGSIEHMSAEYKNRVALYPKQALSTYLRQVRTKVNPTAPKQHHLKEWDKIIRRYNIRTETSLDESTENQTAAASFGGLEEDEPL